jgi:hypothetical protein
MAKRKGQKMQWPNEKDRQCNGQTKRTENALAKRKGQTMQWSNEKDRKCIGQKKRTEVMQIISIYVIYGSLILVCKY